ncbi:MAG: hydroxymethylglutaryl-CoA synthase [Candidatus Dojkabacteria bacterium]
MKISHNVGVTGYGVAIPRGRIKVSDIAEVWKKDAKKVVGSLGVIEKSVPAIDQDAATLAVEAAKAAVRSSSPQSIHIGAVYTGSESHPYAVKSTSAIVGEALGLPNNYTAADLEFACKAGTAAVQIVTGMVSSGMIKYGLAIGSDTAQSRPGDALEYSASAGSAAFLIGANPKQIIAKILHTSSFTSDTPDFWRREHQTYPRHGGRFTGRPAYFKHVTGSVNKLLKETKAKIKDFDHVVFHMPNGRFPKTVAKMLRVTEKQLKLGFTVPYLGNTYSACSLIGLAAVLDKAKPKSKILLASYGSGSGSDAFILEVTDNISGYRPENTVDKLISHKSYVPYTTYITNVNKLLR